MSSQRSRWQKPELIILGRGRPEEAVLAGCKGTRYGAGQLSGLDGTTQVNGKQCPQAVRS